jgi:hypothetical protein
MPHLIVYYPRFVAAPPRDPNIPATSSRANHVASGATTSGPVIPPGPTSGAYFGHSNSASTTADQSDETRTLRGHGPEGTDSTTAGGSGRGDKTPTRDRKGIISGNSGMVHSVLGLVYY